MVPHCKAKKKMCGPQQLTLVKNESKIMKRRRRRRKKIWLGKHPILFRLGVFEKMVKKGNQKCCTQRYKLTWRGKKKKTEEVFESGLKASKMGWKQKKRVRKFELHHSVCFHRNLLHGITRLRIHNSGKPSCGNTSDMDYW